VIQKHGEQIEVLDLKTLSTVTDYFVIGTATSHRQLSAIVDHVTETLAEDGQRVWHVEGVLPRAVASLNSPAGPEIAWVLIDCGDVVVHLFSPPARTLYQLEHFWADAPRLGLDPTGSPLSPSPVPAKSSEASG